MARLEINSVKGIIDSLFCVWQNDGDKNWALQNFYRLNWFYSNDLDLERLKIKLLVWANIYYEFCHQAYGLTLEITEECFQSFDEAKLSFNEIRIRQLVQRDFSAFSDSLLNPKDVMGDEWLVFVLTELVQLERVSVFEELYSNKNFDPDSLFESLKEIIPSMHADIAGLEYLDSWGNTYSNFL